MPILALNVFSAVLPVYDEILLLRGQLLSNIGIQALIALFFAGSLLVAILLFVYWGSCAYYVLSANDVLLTDAEVEPMRWEKKFRALLWNLFNGNALTLP